MNIVKILLVSVALLVLFVLSETVYALNHRDVLSTYILNSAQLISSMGNSHLALYILTESKAQLPANSTFESEFKNLMAKTPEKYDLPRVNYELALSAYEKGEKNLVSPLLQVSIDRDPDFSFWRVELANFYLLSDQKEAGLQVLKDCENLVYPAKHCRDYENTDFDHAITHEPGFLKDSVKTFYLTKNI